MNRRGFIKGVSISPFTLLTGCIGDSNEPQSQTPLQSSSYSTPCYSTGITASSGGYNFAPASQYAIQMIGLACSMAGVSYPANGAYEVANLNNAFYMPDMIGYDPNWLSWFNYITGFQEAGDSILFHEVGHLWAKKTGRSDKIGYGTVNANWAQEYQADSFAGYILRMLNGNASPSIAIYHTILSQWSATHPPGHNRASIFYESWANANIYNYSSTGGDKMFAASANRDIYNPNSIDLETANILDKSDPAIVTNLAKLIEIKRDITNFGLNPYSTESDNLFNQLYARQ